MDFNGDISMLKYEGCDADYTGKGVDQLGEIIRLIREQPYSRRMFMSDGTQSNERNGFTNPNMQVINFMYKMVIYLVKCIKEVVICF